MFKLNNNTHYIKDPKKYKTVQCINFRLAGKCPYGDKCQYAHGPDELRNITIKPEPTCKIIDVDDDILATPSTEFTLNNSTPPIPTRDNDDDYLSLFKSPSNSPSNEKSIEFPTFFSLDKNYIDPNIYKSIEEDTPKPEPSNKPLTQDTIDNNSFEKFIDVAKMLAYNNNNKLLQKIHDLENTISLLQTRCNELENLFYTTRNVHSLFE